MEKKIFCIGCYKITFYPPSEKEKILLIKSESHYEPERKLNIFLKKRKLSDKQMLDIVDCIIYGNSPGEIRGRIKVKFPFNKVWLDWEECN